MKNKFQGLKVSGSFVVSVILATAIVVPALAAPTSTLDITPNFSDLTLSGSLMFGGISGPVFSSDGSAVSLTSPLKVKNLTLSFGTLTFGSNVNAPTVSGGMTAAPFDPIIQGENQASIPVLNFNTPIVVQSGGVQADAFEATGSGSSSFKDVTADSLTVGTGDLNVTGNTKLKNLNVATTTGPGSIITSNNANGGLIVSGGLNVGKALTATRVGTNKINAWSPFGASVSASCPLGKVLSCGFKLDTSTTSKVADVYNDSDSSCKADASTGKIAVSALCIVTTE